MNTGIYKVLFAVLFAAISFSAGAVTPSEALAKAKNKLKGATSIRADFKMTGNGMNVAGKVVAKGSKFAITSNTVSNWYDGKDLYTYNASSQETTIFNPDKDELAEVNPLMYIETADSYKVSGTKNKKAGVETVVLIPKTTGGPVKNVTIELDDKSFLPKVIKITPSSGSMITVTLSNVKLNTSVTDASFVYPKSKYPKAKVVDYR